MTQHPDAGAEAGRRFVRTDAGDRGADDALTHWLQAHPENERALERVELAVELGKRLAADPSSPLYAAAAEAARPPRRDRRSAPALGWGAAIAAASLAAAVLLRERIATPPPGSTEPVALEAARLVGIDAPTNPVALLPNGVVVDASAVAVLPFVTPGEAALAVGLERDVVAALRTVPGLYVIADAAVSSYAGTELSPSEIGRQLGARGIVDASVALSSGRVRVSARLREAATGAALWQTDLERPVDELHTVRTELAEQIAAVMLDSRLRPPLAAPIPRDGGVTASKPLPQ